MDLFAHRARSDHRSTPLADRMRPRTLSELIHRVARRAVRRPEPVAQEA